METTLDTAVIAPFTQGKIALELGSAKTAEELMLIALFKMAFAVLISKGYIFPLVLFSFSPGTFKDQFSAGTFFLRGTFVDTVVLYLLHGTCTFYRGTFFCIKYTQIHYCKDRE